MHGGTELLRKVFFSTSSPRRVEMLLTKNMSITATRRWTRRTTAAWWWRAPLTGEAVDARGDGALVSQVPGDAALVLGRSTSDEGGVEDEAILGSVSSGFEGSGWGHGLAHNQSSGVRQYQITSIDWKDPVWTLSGTTLWPWRLNSILQVSAKVKTILSCYKWQGSIGHRYLCLLQSDF